MNVAEQGVETNAFSEAEYAEMLAEVRESLPLFLQAGASEHHDPLGDVRGLTGLHAEDLRRVIATHVCLSEEVRDFVRNLPAGIRKPITSSIRPREVTQAVRGPIDWGATTRARSAAGSDPTLFVVRPGRRVFDTPENQALLWSLTELERAALRALRVATAAEASESERGWRSRLVAVVVAVRRARRVEWLRDVQPRRPDARTLMKLAAARTAFYRHNVGGVARLLLRSEQPTQVEIVEMLAARYFIPDKAWRLFEILVALRLAEAFAEATGGPRLARLLAGGEGVDAYARYGLPDGDEIELVYQGWPRSPTTSQRWGTAKRHGFNPGHSIPDLMIRRRGHGPDCIVLELKATKSASYLGAGLTQLLGYLGERPELFGPAPAGWLVAPPSDAYMSNDVTEGEPLWIATAQEVAQHAVARFLP